MQSQEPSKAGAKARRCVQRSLLMRLQDAIAGPSVILSFKSQFGFLIAFAAALPQARGQSRTGASTRISLPSSPCAQATLPLPGAQEQRPAASAERRGFYGRLKLRKAKVSR